MHRRVHIFQNLKIFLCDRPVIRPRAQMTTTMRCNFQTVYVTDIVGHKLYRLELFQVYLLLA